MNATLGLLKTGFTQEGFIQLEGKRTPKENLNGNQKLMADGSSQQERHCPNPGRA